MNERREKLRKLFAEEKKMYEEEREAKLKRSKSSTKDLTDPEVTLYLNFIYKKYCHVVYNEHYFCLYKI